MGVRVFDASKWGGRAGALAGLLLAVAGRAQGPAPLLSTADGLTDNTVQCLAQDRQGFLWAGTQDGLSRYDGRAFRTFRADARRRGALAGNFVRALAPDAARGGLWVGTGDGVCYYDPRTERFGHVPTDSAAHYFVNALLADPAGGVWIGTENGRWHCAPATHRLRRYWCAPGGAPASAGHRNSVRALARDAAGTVWAGTGEGQLCRFDAATGTLRPEPRYGPAGPAPLGALAAGPGGGLRAGTEGSGLRYLPPGRPAAELVRPGPGGGARLAPAGRRSAGPGPRPRRPAVGRQVLHQPGHGAPAHQKICKKLHVRAATAAVSQALRDGPA